ncbi:hypothetical protein BB561_002589 [Smittium simulii]|uniref:Enoyl reductase (ER) domain-containing protein n=1 Tax=Smittium simulii TaxID=133385 RepID=A0A2T9YPV7_9FUNG|nr:hypothetical protein BB561_002589 [Smittium simulii]
MVEQLEQGTIKCHAAVAWEAGKPLVIEEIEVQPPRAGEVRIKILYCSICHSDSYTLSGNDYAYRFPMILGHEASGIVESVGPGVTRVKPGDHVIPLYISECKECAFCLSGLTNLCLALNDTQYVGVLADGTSRFTCKGQTIYHFMGISGFSEYTVTSEYSVAKIDEDAPMDKACLIGCCIPTGYGAALNTAKVHKGSTCAVFGCGALGLSVIQGAKACGASKIFAIDINPQKFDMAVKFGATETINPLDTPNENIQDIICSKTLGGVDYSFDTSGGNVSVMKSALESTHSFGGVSVIISLADAGKKVEIDPRTLIGKKWTGCAFGGERGSNLNNYVRLYKKGELKIDEYITKSIKLEEINNGFDDLKNGVSVREIIIL